METSDYYAVGIPLYFLVLSAEHWWSKKKGQEGYHLYDTICNLGCLLGTLLIGVFLGLFTYKLYNQCYLHWSLWHFPENSVVVWILAFLGVDFAYYWWHRYQHRINIFWMIHAVHHQSEDFNLGVGLRQSWFSDLTSIFFYWPLPFLGIPPLHFFVAAASASLYALFMHTNLITKSGKYGLFFVTPASHRVHHSRLFAKANSNFGAVLIVWDRLFGTFNEPDYKLACGTSKAFKSWNPVYAQLHQTHETYKLARSAKNFVDRIKIWFKHPGWIPKGAENVLLKEIEADNKNRRYDYKPGTKISIYALLHFFLVFLAALFTLLYGDHLPTWQTFSLVLLLIFTMSVLGGLLDNRPWAFKAEILRLFSIVIFTAICFLY